MGASLFIVTTQELCAGAHGHTKCPVSQLNSLEVIGTLAGEAFPSCFDEAQMRTATVVGTTRIVHCEKGAGESMHSRSFALSVTYQFAAHGTDYFVTQRKLLVLLFSQRLTKTDSSSDVSPSPGKTSNK